MSYILDALKRADAERERGTVPGLHARQLSGPADQPAYRLPRRVWTAIAAVLVLAGAAAAGLWIWQTPVTATRLAATEPAAPKPLAPAPLALPAAVPATPSAAETLAARSSAPTTARPASRPAPAARALAVAPLPKAKPDPVAKQVATPTAMPAVQLFNDLPEELRRQIPALAITGSVYSKNPGQRLLLVNNQVLPQGSVVAPEVTLEEIQSKGSVFSFRGARFRMAH